MCAMELKEFCKFVDIKYNKLLFCSILMSLTSEPPKWNDVEPFVPFLINTGVPTDEVKFSWESDLNISLQM